jgi:hypothetical protein
MNLTKVESSMIYAFGYDEKSSTLEVVFNSGRVYRYLDVPKEEYDGLSAAESKGSFMLSHIIDCYDYEQVRGRRR